MKEKKSVPKRRFKEFQNDEAWEQRKLGMLVDISTGKLDANAMVDNGAYDFYTSGIKKYRIDIPAFEGPAITIAGNGATVGYMHLADGKFNAYQRTYVLEKFRADRQFLFSEISNKLPQKIKEEARAGNIPYIVMDTLTELIVYIPVSEEEQIKVGIFIKNLDNLITLHQLKLKKLKETKSAYLSEMFPKEGEKYPKRRFAGFTDPWEQRKLKEVAEIVGGGTPSTVNPEYWNGDIDWYSPTEIGNHVYAKGSTKKITKLGLEKSSAKILPPDKTVLFTSRAGIGDMAILKHPGATNQGFQSLVLKEGIDAYFIYSMGHLIKKYAEKNASGSTFLEISGRTLGDMPILMPSTNEQQKIGTFFNNLDKLITLHKRKLEKLENLKKAYLNEMFV